MKLSLGFSPCPNDTFIFDAMIHGKIDTEGLDFEVILECPEEARKGRRNKNELTIGVNYKTKELEIGINRGISGWHDGEQYVEFPSAESNVS